MAEDLIKVRETAEIETNSSELVTDSYSSTGTVSTGSEVDISSNRKKPPSINDDGLSKTEGNGSVSSIITSDHVTPISNLWKNKNKSIISFDDPSWLEGLLHEEMEISPSSNKSKVTNGPLQAGNCDLRYCYITDKGKESSDQNDAEVDIDNGVSYLVACFLGKVSSLTILRYNLTFD